MKIENIQKLLKVTIFVFVIVFIFGVSFNIAEAGCPKGKVCYSNSGCGNFNIGNHHYGGSEACAVLGKNCPSGGGGGDNPPPPPPVNGICGGLSEGFNPRTGLFNPSGSCASGNMGGVSWNGTTYRWSCAGYNGGYSSNCGPWNVRPMAGQCGGLNGKITTKQPSSWDYMCSSGPESAISILQNTYKWLCKGTYGGSDASCQSEMLPQVGKCGDSFTEGSTALVDTLPTDNAILCKRGLVSGVNSGSDKFTWTCAGTGGAANSGICTANKVGEGQTATTFSTSTPVTKLTVTGRITPNIVNKGQFCTLSDLEYTTNKGANDSFVVCNVYRGTQVYADKAVSTTGYQVEPGYDYVFKCNDLTPPPLGAGTEGKTQPLKCVLNPLIIER